MNDDTLAFFLLLAVGVGIWLYVQLRRTRQAVARNAQQQQQLIGENALLRAEHLKFQLQPHTLRNLVATLNAAARNLYRSTETLSDLLDYILENQPDHLSSIENEIEFIQRYKSLQEHFIHQITSITVDVSAVNKSSRYYSTRCLPHLSTAYFIENAFKHGDIGHPDFLTISLRLQANTFELTVKNRVKQPVIASRPGVGLKNMRSRLDLFLPDKYSISTALDAEVYTSVLEIRF